MVAEDNKEVKKTGDGKDVDKEMHGRTDHLRRSKEEGINEQSMNGPAIAPDFAKGDGGVRIDT